MRVLCLLLAVLSLTAAAPAEARTHLDSFDRYAAAMTIGTPPERVSVQRDLAGHCGSGQACMDYFDDILFARVRPTRFAVRHELGHLFDARMRVEVRYGFAKVMGYSIAPGPLGSNWWRNRIQRGTWDAPASEVFADAFANCSDPANRGGVQRTVETSYGWFPSPRTFRRVCGLIRREARREGWTSGPSTSTTR